MSYTDGHCENYLHFWKVENDGGALASAMFDDIFPEEGDNGQGLGIGLRMYLGPNRAYDTSSPVTPADIPGPPIGGEPPPDSPGEVDPPGTEPDIGGCNAVFPETCPSNGIWYMNVWEFQNGPVNSGQSCTQCLTWRTSEITRQKAGAWTAGMIMNNPTMQANIVGFGCGYTNFTSYTYGSIPCGPALWNIIYEADDRYWSTQSGGIDHSADIRYARVYNDTANCSVIASSYTPGSTTRYNRCTYYANKYGPSSIAGNMLHEWTHSIGFGHPTTSSSSVPYKVGSYARSVGISADYDTEAKQRFSGVWNYTD